MTAVYKGKSRAPKRVNRAFNNSIAPSVTDERRARWKRVIAERQAFHERVVDATRHHINIVLDEIDVADIASKMERDESVDTPLDAVEFVVDAIREAV